MVAIPGRIAGRYSASEAVDAGELRSTLRIAAQILREGQRTHLPHTANYWAEDLDQGERGAGGRASRGDVLTATFGRVKRVWLLAAKAGYSAPPSIRG